MTTHEKQTFLATYDWAKSWHDLPWAHDEPTLHLAEICRRRPAGKALDIGCGSGTDSVFLAGQGWDVTSLDFVPRALEYTANRAREAGVTVTTVEADIAEWEPPQAYDLVLDHGLLHNMDPVRHPAYRIAVLKALAQEGDFVLLHWHPRHPGQANGRMGPRRVDRDAIQDFFAPELQERFFSREEFEDLPDMVGGGMTQAYYWFRRNLAYHQPAQLLAQVRATLARHGVSATPPTSESRSALEPGLLARIVGPGRLGIAHRAPEPGAARDILGAWARHAGVSAAEAEQLLTVFAGASHANICNAGAPRCGECNVSFCKRLRYR